MLDAIPVIGHALRALAPRNEVLGGLTLHDDRVGPHGKNRLDRELVRHAQIAHRRDECAVAGETLVPPAAQRREVAQMKISFTGVKWRTHG